MITISHADALTNRNKSVGGQVAVDIERLLNYEYKEDQLTEHTRFQRA